MTASVSIHVGLMSRIECGNSLRTEQSLSVDCRHPRPSLRTQHAELRSALRDAVSALRMFASSRMHGVNRAPMWIRSACVQRTSNAIAHSTFRPWWATHDEQLLWSLSLNKIWLKSRLFCLSSCSIAAFINARDAPYRVVT